MTLNANLHLQADFVCKVFGGLRHAKPRKRLLAEIIDEALDLGDVLTAQEICERHGMYIAKACLDDVAIEIAALEAEMEVIVDEADIVSEDGTALSPDLDGMIEIDLSDIDDVLETVDNSGKVIPLFGAVA